MRSSPSGSIPMAERSSRTVAAFVTTSWSFPFTTTVAATTDDGPPGAPAVNHPSVLRAASIRCGAHSFHHPDPHIPGDGRLGRRGPQVDEDGHPVREAASPPPASRDLRLPARCLRSPGDRRRWYSSFERPRGTPRRRSASRSSGWPRTRARGEHGAREDHVPHRLAGRSRRTRFGRTGICSLRRRRLRGKRPTPVPKPSLA